MQIETVYLASLNAAIDRGIADADAGRVADSEQVRKMLLEQIGKDTQPQKTTRFLALAIAFLFSACAHAPANPKLDHSSKLDLSPIAKRMNVPRCQVSVPMSQEDVLLSVKRDGIPHPESREDWVAMMAAIKPGDQLRTVICLTKGYRGLAAGDVFYGLFRDGTMIAEMHTVIIN
jgi:hypothetical protein